MAPRIGFSDAASALDPMAGKGKVISVKPADWQDSVIKYYTERVTIKYYTERVTLLGPSEAECQAYVLQLLLKPEDLIIKESIQVTQTRRNHRCKLTPA